MHWENVIFAPINIIKNELNHEFQDFITSNFSKSKIDPAKKAKTAPIDKTNENVLLHNMYHVILYLTSICYTTPVSPPIVIKLKIQLQKKKEL